MRVAIVTENFLPSRDKVTDSVLHIVDQLRHADHEILLTARDTPHTEPSAHPELTDHHRAVRAMPPNLREREPVASVR